VAVFVVAQVSTQPKTPAERLKMMSPATNVARSAPSDVRLFSEPNPPDCVAYT
jgi:hypothetical protein